MNSRFAVAVHILTLLEQADGAPVTSERMSQSINTNPSLVRRLLGVLAQAGITTSQMGAGGGATLARSAAEVTLLDVYRAVDEGEVFAMPREAPSPYCMVGRNIQASLEASMNAARSALEAELARTTIAEMLTRVRRQETSRVANARQAK